LPSWTDKPEHASPHRAFADCISLTRVLMAAMLCLSVANPAHCQEDEVSPHDASAVRVSNSATEPALFSAIDLRRESNFFAESLQPPNFEAVLARDGNAVNGAEAREPVESNLVIEGLASYGHYRIFASGSATKLYTAGVEYDRHSWGRLLGARMDYVAEFLPVVLLNAPLTQDIWGSPTSLQRKIVPGIGFSPIGFRLLWRDKRAIKPYLLAKGGMLVFTQKALSQQASYENFSLQSATGVNVKMNERLDLRLGLFSDFHFSNGFIVPVDPGLDVMNANLGVSYNLNNVRK
jgi:hypothetical protein